MSTIAGIAFHSLSLIGRLSLVVGKLVQDSVILAKEADKNGFAAEEAGDYWRGGGDGRQGGLQPVLHPIVLL